MSFILEQIGRNIWQGRFSLFPSDLCMHGFTARLGGVSVSPYDSLNMAFHVGDDPEPVRTNRQRYMRAAGLRADDLVTPVQVHGTHIERVGRAGAGRGAFDYQDAIPATDALITNEPGLPLMLCFADCTPVLLADPVHRAVGIAHAGWRGTVKKIAARTAARMREEFGTKMEDLLAGIGPSIGPCCYEVGEEVAHQFETSFPAGKDAIVQRKEGRSYVNLWEANRLQLIEAGLVPSHIEVAGTCTSCKHSWFFSYRADGGTTGRLAAVIALKSC
ncbi:peptidoglycan editing factor PgeF [Selenomonas montiformis]|uniref:peptidoglycan editing factor PgeF n=1 Tax=Selenomonas montiformis TaxID=2652285 RepID=UPI003F88B677